MIPVVALLLGGAVLGRVGLQACANSILRNTAEAGLEALSDAPTPTPAR